MASRPLILAGLAALFGLTIEPPSDGPRGALRVIDADTFDVGGTRVRLHGVDAPEKAQVCQDAKGEPWACGAWSVGEARMLWDGREASCERLDTDRYGRAVSRCAVGREDIGRTLVARGIALAYRDYSTDYVAQEELARRARLGVWQGEFQRPQDYRRAPDPGLSPDLSNVVVLSAPEEGCAIKGNVSGSGRIYHVPGSARYEATVIDAAQGERWFCSVAEAEAAGWRAPR
ncbi:thermonuclease family protein [Rubellimicrobium aerolatum]|uniref:Thermonuclease family protein n=1 Tax=Rubellimicrobium aerolatum TaxID=490979 RepID=A0ABW0S927_9RHOB|nr:thermonuclease family protein [Rubellimicrobium aerolatum]MBP1804799.1 endonuclease YncB(thermonuclease family) [Rubellimicrobium aerolatum]